MRVELTTVQDIVVRWWLSFISFSECRLNLLDHIEALQKHVEDRLEAVEDQIENVERRRKEAPGGWSGLAVSSKLQDLTSAKIVNNTLSDRL